MDTVLQRDLMDWPMWRVNSNASVSVDGQNINDLFSMISRQMDVLRFQAQAHESRLLAFRKEADEAKEKMERENSKLHDRVDRVSRLFEQQFGSTEVDQRIRLMEEKISFIDGQVHLMRPSPIQSALQSMQDQKQLIDKKMAELDSEALLRSANAQFPTGPPQHNVSFSRRESGASNYLQNRIGSFGNSTGQSEGMNGDRDASDGLVYANSRRGFESGFTSRGRSPAASPSAFDRHKKINNLSSTTSDRGVVVSMPLTESLQQQLQQLRAQENILHSHRDEQMKQLTKRENEDENKELKEEEIIQKVITYNSEQNAAIELKIDEVYENVYNIEERVIRLEGGIASLAVRLDTIDENDTASAMSLMKKELAEYSDRIEEVIEDKVAIYAAEKANIEDLKNKADINLVIKKADEVKVQRLNDIIEDLDRKILLLTRDFEEGIEGVQRRHDKKLEFMTQWIIKHVKKGQLLQGEIQGETADIGKTKCLVCDQPVKQIEKDTPYVGKGFKSKLSEQKIEIKRALRNSQSYGKIHNQSNNYIMQEDREREKERNVTATNESDGPWQSRVYYTGGSHAGQVKQHVTSYSVATPQRSSMTPVMGTVHVPSGAPSGVKLGRPQTAASLPAARTEDPETDPTSPSVTYQRENSLGKIVEKAKFSNRPSSAPATRRDSKHKRAIANSTLN